jgi:CHAT domain-containing protein
MWPTPPLHSSLAAHRLKIVRSSQEKPMLLLGARSFVLVFALAVAVAASAQRVPAEESTESEELATSQEDNPGRPVAITKEREQELRQQIAVSTDGDARWRLYNELWRGLNRAGRIAESLKAREDSLEDDKISPGRRSLIASDMAAAQALINDRARSIRLISRAKSFAKDAKPDDIEKLQRNPFYSYLRAEAELERRVGRHEVALAKTRELSDLAWANFNDPSLSAARRKAAAAQMLDNVRFHVVLLVQNNRRQEALSYVQEIERRVAARSDLEATLYQKGIIMNARAVALCSFDDYDGALKAIDASIATFKRINVADQDANLASSYRMRLFIALALGRIGDYASDASAMESARAANAPFAGSFQQSEAEALVFAARGDWASAKLRINVAMAHHMRWQGSESPFYKYTAALQMLYLLNDPSGKVSLGDIDSFVSGIVSTDDWSDARYRGSYVEEGALATAMDRLMSWPNAAASAQAQALAFRIAEVLRINASQGALADGAARLAAGDPKLRALIEEEQQLRFEQASSRRAFAVAIARVERTEAATGADPAIAQRQADDAAKKRQALEASASKLKQLRRQISTQFPVYRELISPDIPTPAALGTSLRQGEAYVNLYPGSKASFIFVVDSAGQLRAQRLDATRDQLRTMAVALRTSFDAGMPPTRRDPLGGFDLAAAHNLYRAVIGPIQPVLEGARTVYLSSGMLNSVPWNVLLTQPATGLANASWWMSSATIVQMPSASALVLTRSRAPKRSGNPFAAFADPSFDGQDRSTVDVAAARDRGVRQRPLRAGASESAATLDYRNVVALPETLDEVRAIAVALNAPEKSVVHGIEASRSRVLKQDLSDVRVVAFATHGLLPGEVPGLSKAGLALSYEGQGLMDSVLTIDDIIGMRLNADWVVLSACNTGFATGAAGDTMSALARGFFASGARSLLVTQWAVESESAKELTVGLFKAYAAQPGLTKAEAVALVQREMLAGKYGDQYSHPYFWAAYFLAGDAAR